MDTRHPNRIILRPVVTVGQVVAGGGQNPDAKAVLAIMDTNKDGLVVVHRGLP
jgi:hypothetical protein